MTSGTGSDQHTLLPNIEVGKKYLSHARMIYLGEVVEVTLRYINIKQCCWMSDMGVRMGELLKGGVSADTEIEVLPPDDIISIPSASFVAFPWRHEIPKVSI